MIQKVRVMIIILLSVGYTAGIRSQTLQEQLAGEITYVVAQDGSGDYTTVQAAINNIPDNNSTRKVIFIKNGTYKEKIEVADVKLNITLIGENADSTILTYDDYSGRIVDGVELGTSTSQSFAADADNFRAMNLTIENSYGEGHQAVALRTTGDRQMYYHCKLLGYQDTYYTWGYYRNYLNDCFIEGATDYIFGRTTVVFDSCQIYSVKSGSYITAASTEDYQKYGYVFFHCRLTAKSGISGIYMGRPWRPYARTVFFECLEESCIRSTGWSQWSGNENHTTCFYAEYHCSGPGSDTTNRVDWSHQLSDAEAANYTVNLIFAKSSNPTDFTSSWVPDLEEDTCYTIVKRNVTAFLDPANSNARLSSLTYNGIDVPSFDPDSLEYDIELPSGTTDPPEIEYTTEDPEATSSSNSSTDIPGMTLIQVTAKDKCTSRTYTINYSISTSQISPYKSQKPYTITNPFSNSIKLNLSHDEQSNIMFKLFDAKGSLVSAKIFSNLSPGDHQLIVKANKLTEGIYFYDLYINGNVSRGKLLKKQ